MIEAGFTRLVVGAAMAGAMARAAGAGDGSVFPQTTLSVRDPLRPTLETPFEGAAWSLQFWIVGHGDGAIEPPEPEHDGPIGFPHVLDGHVFDITFVLDPNQIDPASWVGFHP